MNANTENTANTAPKSSKKGSKKSKPESAPATVTAQADAEQDQTFEPLIIVNERSMNTAFALANISPSLDQLRDLLDKLPELQGMTVSELLDTSAKYASFVPAGALIKPETQTAPATPVRKRTNASGSIDREKVVQLVVKSGKNGIGLSSVRDQLGLSDDKSAELKSLWGALKRDGVIVSDGQRGPGGRCYAPQHAPK